jgi:ribulose-phosphate 3-epimerase
MLKCSTSLWSADLANLGPEIKRVEPYSERFHIDVVDGHYVKAMLFFPDLVRAMRPYTSLPFEVHFMITSPLDWIDDFADAGADTIICALDSMEDPHAVLNAIRARGVKAGIAVSVQETVHQLDDLWEYLDIVTICGTELGIKGVGMDPSVPDKIRRARQIIEGRGLDTEVQADGGIRRETVPLIHAAGADSIVPGSLMFRDDPPAMRAWLASL